MHDDLRRSATIGQAHVEIAVQMHTLKSEKLRQNSKKKYFSGSFNAWNERLRLCWLDWISFSRYQPNLLAFECTKWEIRENGLWIHSVSGSNTDDEIWVEPHDANGMILQAVLSISITNLRNTNQLNEQFQSSVAYVHENLDFPFAMMCITSEGLCMCAMKSYSEQCRMQIPICNFKNEKQKSEENDKNEMQINIYIYRHVE